MELLEILKEQPKEILHFLILNLMESEKISFAEIATIHAQYLENLRKGMNEVFMRERSKVISLWCGNKKDVGKQLVNIIQHYKDRGWANISQEEIDNSKWNK